MNKSVVKARAALANAAIKAITKPMTFLQIEKLVGKQENYELGIVLTNLVLEKRLRYREPENISQAWPMYSVKPFPKNFDLMKRGEEVVLVD